MPGSRSLRRQEILALRRLEILVLRGLATLLIIPALQSQ